ncbi:MAG: hypothetical protein RL701_3968 [Pseudomonadota bacterium]|jgi:hypothetical protein
MQRIGRMLQNIKHIWSDLRAWPPGQRFQRLYSSYAEHDSRVLRSSLFYVALGCFTLGLVFMFDSGPAVIPFTLGLLIVATQSNWLARHLDSAELAVRDRLRAPERSSIIEAELAPPDEQADVPTQTIFVGSPDSPPSVRAASRHFMARQAAR